MSRFSGGGGPSGLRFAQASDWARAIDACLGWHGTVAVAYVGAATLPAHRIAHAVGTTPVSLTGRPLRCLGQGDLLLVLPVASEARLLLAASMVLDRLLLKGCHVLGITAPTPDPIADRCHDSVPAADGRMESLLACQFAVADALLEELVAKEETTREAVRLQHHRRPDAS